jgi:regulator of nucleoside diphosphate kinase
LLTVTAADLANLSLLESPSLARLLQGARIVPSDGMPHDVVTMYSRVLCIDLETGKREILRLVYPADPAGEADISVLTPPGMALLGAAAGQEITFELDSGALRRVRVAEVLYQPEHDLRTRLIINSGRALSSRRTPP